MSTEVAVQEAPKANGNAALAVHQPTDGGAVSVFASEGNFISAQRMAKALQASSLVPEIYKGSISNVLIAMELASRIGCSVLMVMQNMAPVHGKPFWSSTFLIACVNASKRFTALRYEWQGEEGTESWGCRAVARDAETGEVCRGALITIGISKKEGWYGRKGSKWQTIPEQMLMYRAATWWTRVYCPELAMGIRPVDEGEDMGYVGSYGTPSPTEAASEMEAALRAMQSGEIPVVKAEVVEEDDGAPPSESQVKQLEELRAKAREAELLSSIDEEVIAGAIDGRDGPEVRRQIRELNRSLAAHAAGGQASLLED